MGPCFIVTQAFVYVANNRSVPSIERRQGISAEFRSSLRSLLRYVIGYDVDWTPAAYAAMLPKAYLLEYTALSFSLRPQ